jgi:hypothetical protein
MKYLLTILLLAFALSSHAQDVDIVQAYSISTVLKNRTLQQKFGTIGAVNIALPNFVRWARHVYPNKRAMTDAEILATYEFPASWTDWVVKTDAPLGQTFVDLSNGIGSRANITVTHGEWMFNIPAVFAFGQYYGSGSSHASGSWGQTGGTAFVVDHNAWLSGPFPRRDLLVSDTYFMNAGYQESYVIKGFRLKGGRLNQAYTSTYESTGVMVFDAGESSIIEYVYAEGFNTAGFTSIKGTSFSIRNCSSFQNGRFGYLLLGSSSNIIHMDLVSGDDNGEFLVAALPHDGLPGGGTIRMTIVHHETGTRVNRPQGIAWLDGRFVCNITSIHNQNFIVTVPTAFRLNARTFASQLNVGGLLFSSSDGNYTRVIDDVGTGRWYGTGADIKHKPFSFSWESLNGGSICTNYTVTRSSNAPAPTTCKVVIVDGPSAGCPPPTVCPDPVPCPECPPPATCAAATFRINGTAVATVPAGAAANIQVTQGGTATGSLQSGAWVVAPCAQCPECPECPTEPPTGPELGQWVTGPWVRSSTRCGLFGSFRVYNRTVECSTANCAEPKPANTKCDR